MSTETITETMRKVVNRHLRYEYIRVEDVGRSMWSNVPGDMKVAIRVTQDENTTTTLRYLDGDGYLEDVTYPGFCETSSTSSIGSINGHKSAEVILALFGDEADRNDRFFNFFKEKRDIIDNLRKQMGLPPFYSGPPTNRAKKIGWPL